MRLRVARSYGNVYTLTPLINFKWVSVVAILFDLWLLDARYVTKAECFIVYAIVIVAVAALFWCRKYATTLVIAVFGAYAMNAHLWRADLFWVTDREMLNDADYFIMTHTKATERMARMPERMKHFKFILNVSVIMENPFTELHESIAHIVRDEPDDVKRRVAEDARYNDTHFTKWYKLHDGNRIALQYAYRSSERDYVVIFEDDVIFEHDSERRIAQALWRAQTNDLDVMFLSKHNLGRELHNLFGVSMHGLQGMIYRRDMIPYILRDTAVGSPTLEAALDSLIPNAFLDSLVPKSDARFVMRPLADFVVSRVCFHTHVFKCECFPIVDEVE